MNHIDEGTIHAWIDGAVSAEQGREIEAHVAQCAQCSAAVAQARGLVAASSRILNALDDVPANVTPTRKAPAAPTRQWRAASWVTGIAALLLAAVVLRTSREASKEVIENDYFPVRPESITHVQPPVSQPIATPSTASPVVPHRDMQGKAPLADRRADDGRRSLQLSEVVTTSAPAGAGAAAPLTPQPSPLLQPPAAIVDSVITDRDFAGCYAVTIRPMMDVVTTAASAKAAVVQGARARQAAPGAAMRADVAPPPGMLMLDTISQPAGHVVRDASSHAAIGWWRSVSRDSASVNLLQHGVVVVKRIAKKACPEK